MASDEKPGMPAERREAPELSGTGRRGPSSLLVQRLPAPVRAALLVLAVAAATGMTVLLCVSQGMSDRLAVIASLPVGVTAGFLVAMLLILLPDSRSARDRRWLIECMTDISRVDREQRFSTLLMQDRDHELHDLAHAIHDALLSAHKDRLEAARLRRELDSRVQRQTRAAVAELQKTANTDELTGLANRRGFDAAFTDLFQNAAEDGEELALLAVDMDYFKQLNDACGHAAGDAALRAAGEVLRSQLRSGDVAGRVGGDEFLVALRLTGSRDAYQVAQRLMDLYARSPAAMGLPVRWPTFSIGIACAGEQRAMDAGHLREMADQALYAVKRAGRGGVRVWKPQDAAPAAQAAGSNQPPPLAQPKADPSGKGGPNSSARAA